MLVKLRLRLSNAVLAILFSFAGERIIGCVLESACLCLMDHFVPKYRTFEHMSRRNVIDQRTRPLANQLFSNLADDKATLILHSNLFAFL